MFLLKICKALNKQKIHYGLVGGYAVSLHGAIRGTIDIDLVLSIEEKNWINAEQIFIELGLRPRLPVDAKQIFHFRKEYIKNRNLIAWSFFDPINLANQLDVIITHDAKKMKLVFFTIHGIRIPVVSIPDLIKMKTISSRPQDREDIKSLKELLKNGKK